MTSYALYQQLKNIVNAPKDDALLIDVYNQYAAAKGLSKIYDLNDTNVVGLFKDRNHYALYNAVTHVHFNKSDRYFFLNGFGNVVTFTSMDEFKCPINTEKLVEWVSEDDRYLSMALFSDLASQ